MSNADSILAILADLSTLAAKARAEGDMVRYSALMADIEQYEADYRACEG